MATSLKNLQQPDGFSKLDLLGPSKSPIDQRSGNEFFCYEVAFGISSGVLDKKTFCQ